MFQLVKAGSVLQIALATICAFTFCVVQQHAKPYVNETDDYLALLCSFSLSCFLFLVLLFKIDVLIEIPDVWSRLSLDLRGKYNIDSSPMAALMFGVVLASSVFAGVLVALHVAADLDSQRRAQLQRLRLQTNNEEVIPPRLPTGEFHIFLSHCWRTGQDQMRVLKQKLLEMMPEIMVFLDVDDLTSGKGAEFVDVSVATLVFISDGYFTSKNCMRELLRAAVKECHVIVLAETDRNHGGLTRAQVQEQLKDAMARCRHWGLADEMDEWEDWSETGSARERPTASTLQALLFTAPTFEWNRIPAFQCVVYESA